MDSSKTAVKSTVFTPILQVALMLVISLLSITVYDRLRYRTIITVDIEAIMNNKMKQVRLDNEKLDKEKIIQMSQQWARNLDKEVMYLADKYNAIVLARPAVVQGSIDMTRHVMNNLNNGIRP